MLKTKKVLHQHLRKPLNYGAAYQFCQFDPTLLSNKQNYSNRVQSVTKLPEHRKYCKKILHSDYTQNAYFVEPCS